MKRVYLATSYTWQSWLVKVPVLGKMLNHIVMCVRYWRVTKCTAMLLKRNPEINIFSPITHSHHIPRWLPDRLNTHTFWLKLDFDWISVCNEMYVFMQPGWAESYGVNEEIDECRKRGIPVRFITMDYKFIIDGDLMLDTLIGPISHSS